MSVQTPVLPSKVTNISREAVTEAYHRAAKRRRTEYDIEQEKAIDHIVRCLNEYDGKNDNLRIDLTAFDANNPDEGRAWLTEFVADRIDGIPFSWVEECVMEFNFCP